MTLDITGLFGQLGHKIARNKLSKYISIHLYFDQPRREIDILRAAFECNAFTPKTIGAVGFKGNLTAGFLSGWALESVCGNRIHGCPLTTVVAGEGNEDYLARMSEKIQNGTRSFRDLSPFEKIDDEFRATFLDSPNLGMASLDACAEWLKQYDGAVSLYGTFHLSARDSATRNMRNAFKFLLDYPPDDEYFPLVFPFIILKASSPPIEPDRTHIMLYSGAFELLHEGNGFGGHVGPEEADENLLRFADLTECLINNGSVGISNASISLSGSLFKNERDRIMAAFSPITEFELDFC
ncbi:MAG: hypothetical protein JW818_01920 [Pirellulales bacterium]|nr:hypothetical protein [Pirellulales bacterium]